MIFIATSSSLLFPGFVMRVMPLFNSARAQALCMVLFEGGAATLPAITEDRTVAIKGSLLKCRAGIAYLLLSLLPRQFCLAKRNAYYSHRAFYLSLKLQKHVHNLFLYLPADDNVPVA